MKHYHGIGRRTAFASEAMCATSHPLAAQTALEILRRGGNAVDAAVAGAVVLGLCEPMMCGLGGDVFAMVRDPASGRIHGLNGSGRAPAALNAAHLRAEGLRAVPLESVHAITLPGAVDAFERLLKAHGRMGFPEVLEPAIRHAEAGVPVCHRSAIDWSVFGGRLWGAGQQHYLKSGAAYQAGQIFASPAQAAALRLIASEGAEAFYQGAIMQDMLATLQAAGGHHTAKDFAAVAATEVSPIRVSYRGHDLVELPPNGQGATALLLAKILERFDIATLEPAGAQRIHLLAEATRLAYLARNRFIGDPEHGAIDVARLLSDETADALADSIDPCKASATLEQRVEALHRDTVYICVVDQSGLSVSLIYSTFYPFGSGLASERFGISFQNRGAGFNLHEGHPNELQGSKRPLHTLIPGFIEQAGSYSMPFGVMGGPFQAAGHAHFLSNLVDFGMDVQEAIDCPRSFADISTGNLEVESGISDRVLAELAERGHQIRRVEIGMGGAQAIRANLKTGQLEGGSDQRKDGLALGY